MGWLVNRFDVWCHLSSAEKWTTHASRWSLFKDRGIIFRLYITRTPSHPWRDHFSCVVFFISTTDSCGWYILSDSASKLIKKSTAPTSKKVNVGLYTNTPTTHQQHVASQRWISCRKFIADIILAATSTSYPYTKYRIMLKLQRSGKSFV